MATYRGGLDAYISRLESIKAALLEAKRARKPEPEGDGARPGRGGIPWLDDDRWWALFNSGLFSGTPVLVGGAGGRHDDDQKHYWDPNQAPKG